jgi:membrane-bound metal-dependent hydrolase YbcI (DUF457 family)
MAGFATHLSYSTTVGIGYAAVGYLEYQLPAPACLLAGGLCALAGILPDVDSASGVPARETMAFAAAVTPLLLQDRFRELGLSSESIVLASGLTYIVIRFGVGLLLKQCTVHRGMWHSLPAVAIAGMAVFLMCAGQSIQVRLYKTVAVVVGYALHLLLDELYGLHVRRGRVRLKRSFGSALKLWSHSTGANLVTYGKLALLVALTLNDLGMIGDGRWQVQHTARQGNTAVPLSGQHR